MAVLGRERTLSGSAMLAFAVLWSSSVLAQHFTDVSAAAGLHRDLTRAWGNPLWGDLNNDGHLDLLVPNHETRGVVIGPLWVKNARRRIVEDALLSFHPHR